MTRLDGGRDRVVRRDDIVDRVLSRSQTTPSERISVDHDDGVKTDGGVDNAEYCAACTQRVAREDRTTHDGLVYHRRCSPDDDLRTDGGESVETEWQLNCLDCDFEQELVTEGHPRAGPPDIVRNRVTTHKHTTDESHIVRVEGRRADRDDTIDPSLVTDGGSSYCAACNRSVAREDRVERGGEVYHRQCAPDDAAENRRLDNPAWKDRLRTDGGFEELNEMERQADALEDVAEQLRIQNAALVELTRTLDKLVAVEMTGHPEDGRSGRSVAGWVEDAALDLEERVDMNAVDRAAKRGE